MGWWCQKTLHKYAILVSIIGFHFIYPIVKFSNLSYGSKHQWNLKQNIVLIQWNASENTSRWWPSCFSLHGLCQGYYAKDLFTWHQKINCLDYNFYSYDIDDWWLHFITWLMHLQNLTYNLKNIPYYTIVVTMTLSLMTYIQNIPCIDNDNSVW